MTPLERICFALLFLFAPARRLESALLKLAEGIRQ
jgi:hypothetical protein